MADVTPPVRKTAVVGVDNTASVRGASHQGERPVRKAATASDAAKGAYTRKAVGLTATTVPDVDSKADSKE